MWRNQFDATLVALTLWALFANPAGAHPASGIAVDDRGRVYFQDTGQGLWRIDEGRRLTLVTRGGVHWMAVDRSGSFATSPKQFGPFARLTPAGEKPALIGCTEFPCVVANDGNLYYARMHSPTIVRRSPSGEESVLVEKDKFASARDFAVTGIACGPDGVLYLVALDSLNRASGQGEHQIWTVKPDGTIRKFAEGFLKEKDILPAADSTRR